MKSIFEELGGTYTLGEDGMLYPNLMIEETDSRPIGKCGRMHRAYVGRISSDPISATHTEWNPIQALG